MTPWQKKAYAAAAAVALSFGAATCVDPQARPEQPDSQVSPTTSRSDPRPDVATATSTAVAESEAEAAAPPAAPPPDVARWRAPARPGPTPVPTTPTPTPPVAPPHAARPMPTVPVRDPPARPTRDRRAPGLDYKQACNTVGCHEDLLAGPVVHFPVKQLACHNCHVVADAQAHTFEFKFEDRRELCEDCHNVAYPEFEHPPYKRNLCNECHDPHTSKNKKLLRAPNDGSLCFQCHDRQAVLPYASLHGPAAMGGCTLCHSPHGSADPKFIKRPRVQLCLSCHDDMADYVASNEFQHGPAASDCTLCHNPHGTDAYLNLRDTPPNLCFRCHEDIQKICNTKENTIHGAVTTERLCLNCHDPHAAPVRFNLRAEPMALCLRCHDQPRGELVGIGQHLRENRDHHGPIRSGACPDCHNPHGSPNFRMLIRTYPPTFYLPRFDLTQISLCFECHEPDRVLQQKTTTATGFRFGDRNLHFVHVNRDRKSRTCRACHDVHGSNYSFHIRNTMPFGDADLPLNYVRQPNGGQCSPGCHETRRYDREGTYDWTKPTPAVPPRSQ